MNRWYRIHRLRGAVFLILVGVLALLSQWNILRLRESWPLFLIVFGLLMLAERTAWAMDIREQQADEEFDPSRGTLGLSQPVPASSAEPSSWVASASSTDSGSAPGIQPDSPAPEDSGRLEDSDREGR